MKKDVFKKSFAKGIYMNFLIIGDVVGRSGLNAIERDIDKIIEKENIDFVIINGENATSGRGIKEKELYELYDMGADVVTMGNHIYYRKEAAILYKEEERLLIPSNVKDLIGKGFVIVEKNNQKIAVVNLIGKVHMSEINNENITNPFDEVVEIIPVLKQANVDYIFVDFHAEATAEKIAMAYFLEKDVTCVFGTHTHVQTADERLFDSGIAYITDVGMTGPRDSVLGLKKDIAVERFKTNTKIKYECSDNEGTINGVIVSTDDNTKKATSIKRYNT